MKRRQPNTLAVDDPTGPRAILAVSIWRSARERIEPGPRLRVAMFGNLSSNDDEFQQRLISDPALAIKQIRAAYKRAGREEFLTRRLDRYNNPPEWANREWARLLRKPR